MKMIWHGAVRKDSHRNPLTGQPNQFHKGSVITVLMEYLDLRVTSIDDVIADVAHRGSGYAWHTAIYLVHAHQAREKKNVPFYPLPSVASWSLDYSIRPLEKLQREY